MTTTGRQNVAAALVSILTTYKTAHPTLLRSVWTARPGSISDVPAAWVSIGDESIVHTQGTRQRTFSPSVTVVDTFGDNEQTAGRLDILTDGLVDAFTSGVRVNTDFVVVQTGVQTSEESFGGTAERPPVFYRAVTFSFDEIVLMEGRV